MHKDQRKGYEAMKVAISASGTELNAAIDPRFGRAAYFIIADTETGETESVENENAALAGGAGIQSAQFVANQGVRAVITGNCGPNAVQVLEAAGIKLYLGQTGTAGEALERLKKGEIAPSQGPNVETHSGMAGGGMGMSGGGRGMGGGGGAGMGGRGGRGMGGGGGAGMGGGGGRGMGRGCGKGGGGGRCGGQGGGKR